MSGIGDWFSNKFAELTGKTPQQHVDTMRSTLNLPASVTTDQGAAKAFGAAPERSGYTATGGRRFKKGRSKKLATKRRSRR